MTRSIWSRWGPAKMFALVAVGALAVQTILMPATVASADDINPRDLALTDDDAGKEAARTIDQEGSDDRSRWVHLRWQRQEDGPDFFTGPGTIDNTVWVAKDLASARAIFQEQSAKNKDFPEAFWAANGPFALPISGVGDEVSALSACLDCNAKDDIFLHHRVTFRRGVVVVVIYLYGDQDTAPQELVSWFVGQAIGRIPDSAGQAPEHAGNPPAAEQPTNAGAGPAGGTETTAAAPPANAPSSDLIQANPKDLAVRIDEAGKRAEVVDQKDGADERGTWYQVRYEREGSGGRFLEGPVTVFSYVHVAKDVESARQVFVDQGKLNEEMPEADKRVGDKFELKEAHEIGDEGNGLSACERSCNAGGEIYVHKRLVSRVGNVVSVVYLYGLSHEEGTTDWHARYFGSLVVARARG